MLAQVGAVAFKLSACSPADGEHAPQHGESECSTHHDAGGGARRIVERLWRHAVGAGHGTGHAAAWAHGEGSAIGAATCAAADTDVARRPLVGATATEVAC